MQTVVWFAQNLLKAAIFFTLFAFALNNQDDVTVHFFFGRQWTAPLVMVVLTAFASGLLVGVLGMVPRWWRHRRLALAARQSAQAAQLASTQALTSAQASPVVYPPMPPHGI